MNTVVGFIGPEYLCDARQVIRAGLEDHFMGKLLGVPMGVDVCYTNHMAADQNDLENLAVLLADRRLQLLHGGADGRRLHALATRRRRSTTPRRCASCSTSVRRPSSRPGSRRAASWQDGRLTARAGDARVLA